MDGCAPCRMIAPIFSSLALSHPRSVFVRINGPNNRPLITSQNIYSFPTFQFYLNGARVDQFSGANQQKLIENIDKYESQLTSITGENILKSAIEGVEEIKSNESSEDIKLSVSEAYKQFKEKCSPEAFKESITVLYYNYLDY